MKTTRKKKPISLALDRAVLKDLEDWIADQEAPWTKVAVFELAIKDFLKKREGSK